MNIYKNKNNEEAMVKYGKFDGEDVIEITVKTAKRSNSFYRYFSEAMALKYLIRKGFL